MQQLAKMVRVSHHMVEPFGINFIKEIKGEGDWVQKPLPPNPEGFELTWPRLISSGENNNHLHVVATDEVGNDPLFIHFQLMVEKHGTTGWICQHLIQSFTTGTIQLMIMYLLVMVMLLYWHS